MHEIKPSLSVVWQDRESDTKGYAVIDRTLNGISGGGTRVRKGVTIDEVARLARSMSLKNGAFSIPVGGAKGGLDADPSMDGFDALLRRYVKAMSSLYRGEFSTAEDLGITQERIDAAFRANGFSHSVQAAINHSADPARTARRMTDALHVEVDGMLLADSIGGYGVAHAALGYAEAHGWKPADLTVSIQGVGTMGGATALYLQHAGARVTCMADVRGAIVNPSGLDVARLPNARDRFAAIDRGALSPGDRQLDREEWLAQKVDILVPAAVADAINDDNCGAISAPVVVEAANIPTTASAEAALLKRGTRVVPDFVANGGTNAWFWWVLLDELQADAPAAFAKLKTAMSDIVAQIIRLSGSGSATLRDAARQLSAANIATMAARYGD